MIRFAAYIRRFGRDQRGTFIVLFGMTALVVTAIAGAVVDYTRMEERRNRAQIALDGAALALQPAIYSRTADQIRSDAENLVKERAGEGLANVWVDEIDIDLNAGTLTLGGGVDIPMMFVRLVGVEHLTARISSQSTRQKLRLEVALVLDNSGSMDQESRMSHLKEAALNAVDILLEGQESHPDTFIGIVPYTYQVNVGGNQTNPFAWIDRGESQISGDNFVWDNRTVNWINGNLAQRSPENFEPSAPDDTRVDRIWLYRQLNNESWKGCVEARPYPLDVRDVPPARSLSDLNDPADLPAGLTIQETLFVPYFAPDVPDRWGTGPGGRYSYTQYLGDNGGLCQNLNTNQSSNDQTLQMRICKYIGTNINHGLQRGPNADCGEPIVPLTNQRAPVRASIQSMVASGGTNIHLGAMWGWRLLSPNEPFASTPYSEETSKVMILMTDGENTYYSWNDMNGSWFYSAYGHPVNNQRGFGDTRDRADGLTRLGKANWNNDAQFEGEMDNRLEEVCTNAKAAGIKIYSIGLSVPNQRTRNLLTRCASNPQDAYFTNNPSELNDMFASIADQLSSLRLSR